RKIPYVVRRHLTVRSTESFLRTTYGIWRNAAVPKAIAARNINRVEEPTQLCIGVTNDSGLCPVK
ncbi:MAG: hypothetical protein II739_04950, partial [Clostridia bacterium]|nr:hypothetical protein [Clostridia bacterium]